ncbi:D-alanyl-D-alanine carboxypeptidase family protein [Ancylobacter sp. SL191]|uniref:D-alanyl-D-alanine carboxypeptidase family protein n=1 Tax=Ancylobacter sp. SL191 TaxID=2995166 RepID=UPI00226F10EB|nr:D-alanyl-D-alanine carboxypeptidase family protein [Ancylobacter sp. SL191]WAC26696.1 D-alanyl-D-alanine carboxypeptidase [Ancylobacter sp. SL191]
MRVPGLIGTYAMRAGVVLLAASLLGGGVAEAASKKKPKQARNKAAVTRTVANDGIWQRGYSDIVIDANTGRVLHEENADALRHPASVTKVMTLYLLFEQLEARRLRLDSQLRVSAYAAAQQPSKLGVKAGSTISVEDAIQALVTRSANDVAVVIAENLAGDSSSFARRMTQRARSLGMSRTTFKNPNGLPDPQQVTTARDLATLGRAIQERFPTYYAYFEKRSFMYRGVAIRNHNRMLGRIEGVDGIKTGYTNASGFNLLTSVKRDGRYVIAVVMGGASAASRDNRMAALVTEALPRAYAGRQMVARMNTAPGAVDDIAVAAPAAAPVAVAQAPTPAPSPVVAAAAPEVIPVPTANPRVAMASAAALPAPAETDEMTTASVPTPSARTAAPTTVAGAASPIVPVAVKTVPVARPAAPTATFSNQPGILGTLAFTSTGQSVAAAPAAAPAQQAIKKVQLASAGPTEIPMQETERAETAARPRAGGWGIQIGAYGSETDARAQLAKAKQKAGSALSKADPYTEAVKSNVVRARFAGFDAEAAARKACAALKRSDFGCMVFRN